jgi:indolepyruvate ferredoxin oxidoreductase
MERALIAQYEADLALIKSGQITGAAAVALAALPNDIRGFGSVKDAAVREAAKTREALLAQ